MLPILLFALLVYLISPVAAAVLAGLFLLGGVAWLYAQREIPGETKEERVERLWGVAVPEGACDVSRGESRSEPPWPWLRAIDAECEANRKGR